MESQKANNQKKIVLMRNQIMSNISNQRNSVYFWNRKAKEEVNDHIRQLKDKHHRQMESEENRQRLQKLSIIQEKNDSKVNRSLEMFTKMTMARKNYEDKMKLNIKSAKSNTSKIK